MDTDFAVLYLIIMLSMGAIKGEKKCNCNEDILCIRREGNSNSQQEVNTRHWGIYLWCVWEETTKFGEWYLFEIFLKKHRQCWGAVISCVKKMDSSSLPLCSSVIKEKSNEQITSVVYGTILQ